MNGSTARVNRRILIVSSPHTGHLISCAIRGLGDVKLCESAIAALDAIAQEPVDCIVCSMRLPDMHATALLNELARRNIRVPVFVLTDESELTDTVAVMRAGAHHVLQGPPFANSLRERVARALG
jgi:DNA-binding NtrC family response regulator